MRTGPSGLLLRLLIVLVVFAGRAFPQADGVSLAIRFPSGTSQFHVGEVIPVDLSFTASRPKTYDLNTVMSDRSGRLNIEQFLVTPPGRDPLANYYSIGGIFGGGPSSSIVLSNEPWVITDDLNEWVALDTPGHYTFYVTSGRVSRRTAAKNEPQQLRSNSLEFDMIAADAAWQDQTFLRAVSVLNSNVSTDEEKRSAIRRLRFLDSRQSILELVGLMGNLPANLSFECMFGLAGSRYQAQVVHELESQMNAPDTAITENYIYILAKLKTLLEPQTMISNPKNNALAQSKEFMDLEDALLEKIIGLVSIKQGRAQAQTIATLLTATTRDSQDMKPLRHLSGAEVASAFLELPADQQSNLLSYGWERLRVPAMVKTLETIAAEPETRSYGLRDAILQRLYELDPKEGRRYILDEIKQPHLYNGMYTVKGETLSVLPEATLPEFDEMLATRLEHDEGNTMPLDAQLIARYSTKAILPKVKAVYENAPGKWDCVTEDGLVLYFLRADPDYGVKCMAAAPSVCMTESIPAVIKMKRWDEIETSVIAQLNNPDLWRARQAAETLSKYGDDKAETAIWDRLRRFHQQWAGRENDLIYRPDMPRDADAAMGFQFGLVESLAHAQAWLLSNHQIDELESLTFGSARDYAKRNHWDSPVELNLSLFFDGRLQAIINNQYSLTDITALCVKLRQYPNGTKFRLTTDGEKDRLDPVVKTIEETAAEVGLTIETAVTQ